MKHVRKLFRWVKTVFGVFVIVTAISNIVTEILDVVSGESVLNLLWILVYIGAIWVGKGLISDE